MTYKLTPAERAYWRKQYHARHEGAKHNLIFSNDLRPVKLDTRELNWISAIFEKLPGKKSS
jgi:hypothetical protein